jgi:hypothetical protein|tara:strand:- start:12231 stop:13181 length:951 start_codon:yes stop_codon:yes gene_type:complete
MSKILNVNTGNYVARVSSGNTITFDTGTQAGTVVITGDLQINGTQTTVNSQTLDLVDNIITLNKGESGAGVTENTAGLQIDRGTATDALLIFDEQTSFNDPVTQTVKAGTFVFKTADNAIIGLRTNAITTGGGDLYLINSGTGVISVSGTNNYESQITDDDDIPNKKYVDDTVTTGIQTITIQSIARGDSSLNLFDESIDGGVSNLKITIDGTEVAQFKKNTTEIEDIVFQDNTISTLTSATDLTLSSSGTSFVTIDGILKMPVQAGGASINPGTNIAIYGKDPAIGNSGVWYKNKDAYEDELISTNRSLLFSMLF